MPRYDIEYEYAQYGVEEFVDEDGVPYESEVEDTYVDWIQVEAIDKDDAVQQAYDLLYDRERVSVVGATLSEDDDE